MGRAACDTFPISNVKRVKAPHRSDRKEALKLRQPGCAGSRSTALADVPSPSFVKCARIAAHLDRPHLRRPVSLIGRLAKCASLTMEHDAPCRGMLLHCRRNGTHGDPGGKEAHWCCEVLAGNSPHRCNRNGRCDAQQHCGRRSTMILRAACCVSVQAETLRRAAVGHVQTMGSYV